MDQFLHSFDLADVVAMVMAAIAIYAGMTARLTANSNKAQGEATIAATVNDAALDLVKALKTEIGDLRKDVEFIKRDNAQLRAEIVLLTERIEKLKAENDALRATTTLLGQQLVAVGQKPMFPTPEKTKNGDGTGKVSIVGEAPLAKGG